jgi:hypothetical protein
MIKSYELHLPVFKQGDDLAFHLKGKTKPADAFLRLAKQYEGAAEICRRVAGRLKEIPKVTVDAGTHMILIDGPEEALVGLVKDKILAVVESDGGEEGDG